MESSTSSAQISSAQISSAQISSSQVSSAQILSPSLKQPSRSLLSNLAIAALSAGLLIWSANLIYSRVTSINSVDAVINGVLTDIKAPQSGNIASLSTTTGNAYDRGKPLLTIQNRNVNQSQVQSLQSKLNQQRMELERATAKLAQQIALLQTATADQENQRQLEVSAAQNSIEKVASDLKGAQARYRLAKTNYDRTQYLKTQGAVSQSILDGVSIAVEERQSEVDSLEKQLKVLQANQQAAKLNLSLDKTSSDADPRLRMEGLQTQIQDQHQLIQALKQSIQDAQRELTQATADLQKQQTVVVNAPTTGIIWRLNAQSGKFVQQGESLGQMIDCNRRWVDAFVDEQSVRSLHPGIPATIKLYGASSDTLSGRVSMIRPGAGRLAAGEDVVIPATPNFPRQAQVRVELEPDTNTGEAGRFCYVGYTAQVSFKLP